jgi:hypothetical protein
MNVRGDGGSLPCEVHEGVLLYEAHLSLCLLVMMIKIDRLKG